MFPKPQQNVKTVAIFQYQILAYQIYLKEHMCCELETGVHVLRLENLDLFGRFELDNFRESSYIT